MAKRNDLPTVSLARIADNPPQRKRKNNQRTLNVAPVGGHDADRLTYLSRNHRVRWWAAVDSNHLPPRYQSPSDYPSQSFVVHNELNSDEMCPQLSALGRRTLSELQSKL